MRRLQTILTAFAVLIFCGLSLAGCASAPSGSTPHAISFSPILRPETGMHTAGIQRISVDRTGSLLLTASQDKTARLWSLPDGHLLQIFRPPEALGDEGKPNAGALSPDGMIAAVGGSTGYEWDGVNYVYLFEAATGALRSRLSTGENHSITHLAFSPDGRFLIACLNGGGTNGSLTGARGGGGIEVWETTHWTMLAHDSNYDEAALGIPVIPAFAGDDSSDYIWPTYGAEFDHSDRVATTNFDGGIRLYDTSFHIAAKIEAPGGTKPFGIAFSPNGHQIAVGYLDVSRVDVLSGTDLHLLSTVDTRGIDAGPNEVGLGAVAWSSDGKTLFAGGGGRRSARQTAIHAWAEAGRGPRQDVPVDGRGIASLQGLAGGGVAHASITPPTWATARTPVPVGQSPQIADFEDPDGLRLSADGTRVAFKSYDEFIPHIKLRPE